MKIIVKDHVDELTELFLKRDYPNIKVYGEIGEVVQKLDDGYWRVKFKQFQVSKTYGKFKKKPKAFEFYFKKEDLTII